MCLPTGIILLLAGGQGQWNNTTRPLTIEFETSMYINYATFFIVGSWSFLPVGFPVLSAVVDDIWSHSTIRSAAYRNKINNNEEGWARDQIKQKKVASR